MRYKSRDWGYWIVLWKGKRFKIKLLRFKQGGAISLQRHIHRGEFWVCLKGYGKLRKGNQAETFSEGSYANIPRNYWHRYVAYRNTWILEIQYGEQCEETDIIRAGL